MKKIALIYGPVKGSTERVAIKIANEIGNENIDLLPVKDVAENKIMEYDKIIFGIATIGKDTWDLHHPNTDWDDFLPKLRTMNLQGKTVAMFGLGDNIKYASLFVDALGVLGKEVLEIGGKIIGQVSTDNYDFQESQAIIDGKFIGLPINEDHESHLTDERIKNWVAQIKPEFGL
ncbi:MAG: flavodoxin [Chlorobi bacterium]|nr:flavodoxin [Chlorobiota bacterium]